MKRKIIYGLITATGLVGVYCLLHFGFGMFHCLDCSNDFDSKADIKKGDIHLISYGLPDFGMWDKMQAIAKGYGFTYQNRGCVVSGDEDKCADIYNKEVIEYLSIRNGKDWFKRFEKSVDSLEKIVYAKTTDSLTTTTVDQPDEKTTDTVLAIVRKLPKVQKLENEVETLSKNKRHINYAVLFDDSAKTVYDVRVGEDNGMSVATYFHFRVDSKTLKILNPDGKY